MQKYFAIARDGSSAYFTAYTYSDIFQQATDWASDRGGLLSLDLE